jgi:sporulation protein YlmC with PRC-barrel domain
LIACDAVFQFRNNGTLVHVAGFPSINFDLRRTDMLARYTLAALAGSALLASAVFAQSPTATTTDSAGAAPATSAATSSFQGDWRASKMVGLSVYNDKNESVGSINDMLTDKSGSIKAVIIGVGGFLGVGEHLVAVPFDKVKFVSEPVAYSTASGSADVGSRRPAGAAPSTTTTGAANTTPPAANTTPPAVKANPWYPDHAIYNATKDELKAMPEFKYSTN